MVQHRASREHVEAVAACWLVIHLPKSPKEALGSFSLTFCRAQELPLHRLGLYLLMSKDISSHLMSLSENKWLPDQAPLLNCRQRFCAGSGWDEVKFPQISREFSGLPSTGAPLGSAWLLAAVLVWLQCQVSACERRHQASVCSTRSSPDED